MSATLTETTGSYDRFGLDVQLEGDVAFASLVGELDHHTSEVFRSVFAETLRGAASSAVLDCADLTFLDSAGVAALLDLNVEITRRGGHVIVTNPREIVQRVLAIVGLGSLISQP